MGQMSRHLQVGRVRIMEEWRETIPSLGGVKGLAITHTASSGCRELVIYPDSFIPTAGVNALTMKPSPLLSVRNMSNSQIQLTLSVA